MQGWVRCCFRKISVCHALVSLEGGKRQQILTSIAGSCAIFAFSTLTMTTMTFVLSDPLPSLRVFSGCLQTVSSGPQAIKYFQGDGPFANRFQYPLPKIVLLDFRMPRMNGLQVLGWLRSQPEFRGVVVIVFTAPAHPDDITRACELGANAFGQKPSRHNELIKFLKLLKAFWADFHQFPPPKIQVMLGELAKPGV